MKRFIYYISLVFCFISQVSFSQQISEFSQYLNNSYLINPAASDLQNGLNIQLSYRSQKNLVFRTTDAFYISAYSSIKPVSPQQETEFGFRKNKKLVNSSVGSYNAKLTQVFGTIISKDNFGLVDRYTAHINYGIHLPLNSTFTLSTAATLGYVGLNVSDDYFVFETGDLPFDRFISGFQNQNFLDVGLGIWLYSNKIQFGYSIEKLFRGNSLQAEQEETFQIQNQHFVYLAYQFRSNRLGITPSSLVRIDNQYGKAIDINLKIDYSKRIWLTGSLRDSEIFVFNVGFKVNPQLVVNYSYDQGAYSSQNNTLIANEIMLKIGI